VLALTHACIAYQNAMMRRMKPILVAGLCGALVALLATRIGLPRIASIPFFRKDHALLSQGILYYAGLACWVTFSVYWDIAAKNSAPAKGSETKASRGLHVVPGECCRDNDRCADPGRFLPLSSLLMTVGLAWNLRVWAWRSGLGGIWAATGAEKSRSRMSTN
jgi:hypothetical protein